MLAVFAVVYDKLQHTRRGICSKRVKRYGVVNSELSLLNRDVGEESERPIFSPFPSVGPKNEPCLS